MIRLKETLELLGEIESDLGDQHSPENAAIACECATIRSVALVLGDDTQQALPVAEDCLGRSNDPWTTNVASNVVRLGCLKAGDLAKFYATPWIPYSLDEDRRNLFASVYRPLSPGISRGPADPLDRGRTLLPRRSCIGGTIRRTGFRSPLRSRSASSHKFATSRAG